MLELQKKGSLFVLVGDYNQIIDQLLLGNIKGLSLVPRVLWIDYRIIPIAKISQHFKTAGLKSLNEIFFIEIDSIEILTKLIRSGELKTAVNHTFRTIIINIPPSLSIDVELLNELNRLAEQINFVLFTRKNVINTLNSVIVEVSEE
ncbi:MAG: hypothetical protein ACTSPG_03780 [Candidatus Hodarchaeales archaeon]